MDTAKLKGFLHELTSNLESVELDDAELSLEFPSPEELIQDGADPQFALYSTVQTQLLSIAVMLEKSGIVEDYHAAVESGLETYMPGFPPMSPVTDSYFYLWALLDLKFGTDRDNIGRVAVEVLKEAGAPAQLFDIYDNLLSSRMGIYETIGDDGDLLVVRELVTGRELLVDAPTGYLGSDGELRFVRLAPPSSAQVEYFTELTTPYILTGRSADDWTAYLLKMMPPRVDAGDGVASTNMDDRLAAVFKDDRGVMPWLEFVFQSFHSFEDDVIYLSGIPDDPESLAHGNHTTATNSTMNPDSGGQAASQGVLRLPHASGTSDEIKVALTEAQRQVAAELMPGRAGVFKPESKGKKPIRLPAGDWKQLRTLADTRLSRETGRGRTRVKNLRTAIDSAFLPDDTTPLRKTDASIETVYRMRIDLNGVTPPIWRRVEVLDCSLAELHCVVQAAMGWDDSHLHEFTIDGQRYSIPNPYGHPDDFDAQDSTDTRLSHLMRRPGKKFTYMYDFGDSWDHTIKVEAIEPADPRATYPRCVTGKRNCPPEDCGGIWGYEELVEILSDPNHPEYEERIDWCGELDSESFSAASCTRLMRSWWAEVAQPEQAALPQQMSDFDINEDFFTDDELDEDAFQDYSTHLQAEFLDSPEFDSLPEGEYGFVDCLLHYGVDYLEVTPATMTVADLHEVLFEITPRKVMLGPEEAEITILELNAFFQFIHREYSVPGAGRLVTALDNSAVQRLTEKLSDQSNFGMAKSFFKMGHAAGFDMTSEDGLQQFAAAYNSSLPVQDDDDAATTPSLSESDALTTIRRDTPRIGRNAPCPCGSGRKYKKCCLGKDGS